MPADPDSLVPLTTARTEFEASTIAAALESSGIPAKVFSGAATVLQFGQGSIESIRIMVRRADLDRAGAALRAIKQDSVDIDWSEVDVGDTIDPPDAFPMCPACGYQREGVPPGQPCPECGYNGVAANRHTPVRRATYRAWILRVGGILLIAAFTAGAFAPRNPGLVLAILIVAIAMIIWGGTDKRR